MVMVAALASIYLAFVFAAFGARRRFWRRPVFLEGVGRGVAVAVVLTFLDVAVSGSSLFSILTCPIWFVVSLAGSAIKRPGWRLALARAAIPAATLALVLGNDAVQERIAESNVRRVIAACEAFRAAEGEYPKTLDDLAPRFLPAVPPAKYCLIWNRFWYFHHPERSFLFWHVVPPYGRKIWNFEDRRWSYLD